MRPPPPPFHVNSPGSVFYHRELTNPQMIILCLIPFSFHRIGSGTRFTNAVLLTIKIWLEFQHALVSWSFTLCPPNFAQVSTAQLLRPAEKMLYNNQIFLKPQHVEILITFEL